MDGSGTLCLENTACVNADGLTCRTKAASMTFCNAPSKATCKAKLPDGTTDNPCFAKKDTYSNASTVCLKYTGCVKADGSTCTAVTASSAALCVTNATCTANKITEKFTDGSCRYETGTNRTDGSCAVGYETNKGKCSPLVGASLGTASASKASCTAKLPDGTTANPCWTNYTTPTYQWDASGTVCLENSACVNADGLTCRTKTASSAAYCPKKMWFCDTSSSTGTCTQTADSYKSISACQNVLTPTGNNGFCFTSESLCKTGCP